MISYLTLVFIIVFIIQTSVKGNKLNYSQRANSQLQQQEDKESFGFLYNRWDRDDISENEVSHTRGSNANRSQKGYGCGRPIASKKYKEMFLRETSYQNSRSKYRPLEIRMPRIIGGDETDPGEFPWTVSVKLNGQPICGGSLIERSWILTAAHCVVGYNPKNLTVRLGAYRIKDSSETQTVDLPVSMFIVHRDYSMPRPFSNDIALLKMSEPVEFTDFILPICLPTEDQFNPSITSNIIMNDEHANRYDFGKDLGTDSGGIVVSTKMSDTDIAECFNRLEQNYLNSIGLGASAEATTEQSPAAQSSHLAHQKPNQLISYGDNLIGSTYGGTNTRNQNHNKVAQSLGQIKPTEQHFDELLKVGTNVINQFNKNSYIYYGPPWDRKNIETKSEDNSKKDQIKLSRLPINKELLREIQSIGSGPMPTLNLALQQGDLVAMANDLTRGGSHSDRGKPANLANVQLIRHINGEGDVQTEYSGLNGIVVGWGWVRELDGEDQLNNKGYPSVTLQKVKLPILRNSVCEAWFQSQSKKITLLPSQFCAGFNSGGKDACRVSLD